MTAAPPPKPDAMRPGPDWDAEHRMAEGVEHPQLHVVADDEHLDDGYLDHLLADEPQDQDGGDRRDDDDRHVRQRLVIDNLGDTLDQLRGRLGTGATAGIFRRGDAVVNVPRIGERGYQPPDDGDDGPAQVRTLNATALAAMIDATFAVMRSTKDHGLRPALMSKSVTERIIAAPEHVNAIRPLTGVVHTPVLRPDWSMVTEPGYDPATRLLFLPDPQLGTINVPLDPGDHDVEAARDLLLHLLSGFPFDSESDRANYIAAMLAPLIRPALPTGSTLPLLVLNAPMPGSGKTLLAEILMMLFGGVFRTRLPDGGDEVRKQITTVLERTTAPVIVWDNIIGTIRSADLAALLTTTMWNDRILGESRDVSQPNDRLWVVTGNNVNLGGDLARRGVWVTIDPNRPNPHLRTGFAIEDMRSYVSDHRADLLSALLTCIRSWVVAGASWDTSRSDTFAGFADVTAAVLAHVGIPGTVMGAETNRADVGADDDEWAMFLAAVRRRFGDEEFTIAELVDAMKDTSLPGGFGTPKPTTAAESLIEALPEDLAAKFHNNYGPPINKSLGMWFRNRAGRWAGGRVARAASHDTHRNTARYRVDEAL